MDLDDGLRRPWKDQVISPLTFVRTIFIIQKYHAVLEINVLVYALCMKNIYYTCIHDDLFNVLYESH